MSSTQEVGEIFGVGSGPAHAMLRSPTVLIASVGLWGMNVYFFRLFGINYVKVLKYDLEREEQEKIKKKIEDDNNMDDLNLSCSSSSGAAVGGGGGGGVGGATTASTTVTSSSATMTTTGAGASSNSGSCASAPPSGELFLLSKQQDYYSDDDDGTMLNAVYAEDNPNTSMNTTSTEFGFDDEYYISSNDRNSDSNNAEITWGRLVGFSLSLLLLLHSTYWIWIDILGRNQLGAIFAFYLAVTTAIIIPLPSTKWLRKATVLVLQRSFELVNPRCNCVLLDSNTLPRAVPFVDVFFADAMCSLSKVFFDWGMLFHMAAHYPHPVPKDATNILIPSAFAAVPFVIRARQCLIMYNLGRLTNDSKRFQHLANALKYSTSIFPLLLSAYQKTITDARSLRLEPLLILLLAINALYALYWDIVMDWGMLQHPTAVCYNTSNLCTSISSLNAAGAMMMVTGGSSSSVGSTAKYNVLGATVNPSLASPSTISSSPSRSSASLPRSCGHAFMRPRLRFGVAMSAFIVMADAILRFSWTLRFYHRLFPSNDSFVLCTQFLEVFRRAIWNLLRVEWEHLKQKSGKMGGTSGGGTITSISSLAGGTGASGSSGATHHRHHHLSRSGSIGATGGVGGAIMLKNTSGLNRPDPPGSPIAGLGATSIMTNGSVGPVGGSSSAGGVVGSATTELTNFITKKANLKQATA